MLGNEWLCRTCRTRQSPGTRVAVDRSVACSIPALLLLALVVMVAAWPGSAQESQVIVEDWSRQSLGQTGVPSGWERYETPRGRPAYDFTVVEDAGWRALLLKSHDDHSTIAREIRVDLRATPILEWTWRIVRLPAGADIRRRETSDLTGHLFVVWPRFPGPLRSRLVGYVWDASAPVDTMQRSRKTGTVTFFVTRSGTANLNRWLTERRNVYEDYRSAFGEYPESPSAVAISIDTNDTHSEAEALIGPIRFTTDSADPLSTR